MIHDYITSWISDLSSPHDGNMALPQLRDNNSSIYISIHLYLYIVYMIWLFHYSKLG